RHAAFRFGAQWNSGFGAETELERPVDDRLCAGLYSNLIKPGVARLGQGLDKIQRALIALFPIVKRDVTDLDRRDALIKIARAHHPGLECGDSDRDFEG